MYQQAHIHGVTQAFIDTGEGQPLVFIHGSLCDHRYWRWQSNHLAQHVRCIVPSLRHYWPVTTPEITGFSAEQHAQDLIHLLDYLDLERAHFLGHSRGAAVALRVAQLAPERISSLLLADPGLRHQQALDHSIQWKTQSLTLIEDGDIDAGLELFIDAVSGAGTWRLMVPWFKTMVRDNAGTLVLQQHEPPVTLDEVLALGHPPVSQERICLIGGAQSPAPFPQIIETLANHWPHATVHRLANATHGMNLAVPHAFNEAVLAHVRPQVTYSS